MTDKKHLFADDAIEKLRELTEGNTAMLVTHTGSSKIQARPMSTVQTDELGHIFFLSDRTSNQNSEIKDNPKVDLLYANKDGSFCTVRGEAEISANQALIDELWSPIAKAWFTEGPNDPRVSVLRVIPEDAYYWDTKHGKLVSFLKIAVGAATGITMDDGIQGQMHV